MGIASIPNEVCLMIANNLSFNDLYQFFLTCRGLSSLLAPRLHELGLQDFRGLTALQWAAVRGRSSLVKVAVSKGAEIDKPTRARFINYDWLTLASWARKPGSAYDYLENAARTNAGGSETNDANFLTPLSLAAACGRTETIEALLELGASTEFVDGQDAPAHISARRGDVDCVRTFLSAGVDIAARGPNGRTLLHEAAPHSDEEMTEYLLTLEGARAIIDAQDSDGCTPLYCAVSEWRWGSVELLLQYGADCRVKNSLGDTPAHAIARSGRDYIMRSIVDVIDVTATRPDGSTILHDTIKWGSEEIVELLLGREGGRLIINARDITSGSTPLHRAAGGYSSGMVKVVLKHGANIHERDIMGRTPLHLAAGTNTPGAVKVLLQHGANIHERDTLGRTPLLCAVERHSPKVAKVLLQQGANIEDRDIRGRTPLHCAVSSSDSKMAKFLLQHGANIYERSGCGRTPMQLAVWSGDGDCLKALRYAEARRRLGWLGFSFFLIDEKFKQHTTEVALEEETG